MCLLLAGLAVVALQLVDEVFGVLDGLLELLLLGRGLARFLAHRTEPVLETTQRIGKPLALRLDLLCSEVLLTEAVLKVSDGGCEGVLLALDVVHLLLEPLGRALELAQLAGDDRVLLLLAALVLQCRLDLAIDDLHLGLLLGELLLEGPRPVLCLVEGGLNLGDLVRVFFDLSAGQACIGPRLVALSLGVRYAFVHVLQAPLHFLGAHLVASQALLHVLLTLQRPRIEVECFGVTRPALI